jgi:DNA repair protein RadC
MRELFQKSGFSEMSQEQILEFILFYAIPRKDTKPVAIRLLDKFGSFSGVIDAGEDELSEVEGIGAATAFYLKMFREVFGIYLLEKKDKQEGRYSLNKIGSALQQSFMNVNKEIAILLCLDSSLNIISQVELSQGSYDHIELDARAVIQAALYNNSTHVILAHNHPGSTAIPSRDDIESTLSLQRILKEQDIILLDHLIFSNKDFISLYQSNLMKEI